MKTKQSRKDRTCHLCKASISRGDRYATKSIAFGKTACWTRDDRPSEEIPAWAWEPCRVPVSICEPCADKN